MTKCFACKPDIKAEATQIFQHDNQQYALCDWCSVKAKCLGWKYVGPAKLDTPMAKTVA